MFVVIAMQGLMSSLSLGHKFLAGLSFLAYKSKTLSSKSSNKHSRYRNMHHKNYRIFNKEDILKKYN